MNEGHDESFSPMALAEFHVTFEQARFFFSDALCDWLDQLWLTHVPAYFVARLDRTKPDFLEKELLLLRLFEELPLRFRSELALSQLKCPITPPAAVAP